MKTDEEPASSWIQVRVSPRRKAGYVRAARPGKLTTWILDALDRAAILATNTRK